MATYREQYESHMRDAADSIKHLNALAERDLFQAHIYLSEAIESLQEADKVLLEVSKIAFDRVVK